MKSWMIYEKIQEMKRNKLNKSQVSRRLGIDYKTVMKYWDMPPDGFAEKKTQAKVRAKKSDKLKVFYHMKRECIDRKSFRNQEELGLRCFEYLNRYNTKRPPHH